MVYIIHFNTGPTFDMSKAHFHSFKEDTNSLVPIMKGEATPLKLSCSEFLSGP
jgi:hypothetical protein